ncbi:NAD(P)H-dependent oxidoreductase [Levilactobacillus tongjiangensis]|uniref:NAD(P)H-dependent oxidoreductase n=1 Tax=Levilactobacillus tongjiangensis TaxID=2486023 RepID=A0ABW1ST36_9LACO|nr:NAD(P)H-dependent oxidoreductase [Levilactobacillus tongjiangensis]
MKTVIIFDHPYTATAGDNVPHHRSFLAALLKQVTAQLHQENNDVDLIDLHADGFNPVMSADDLSNWRRGQPIDPQVADYQQRLLAADRIIFMFPVWWEVMPAMTKGFLDKVYAKGQLYQADNMQTKLTKQPKVDIITTMSTPNWAYRLLFGAPLAKLLFRGTFLKTRLWHFKWHNFAQVEKKSLAQRQQVLRTFTL